MYRQRTNSAVARPSRFGPLGEVMYAPYELARVQTQVPYARKSRYLLGIEQRRSDYLRFRHCSSTTTAPVTPQIPIEANVGDLTSPEKALAFSVSRGRSPSRVSTQTRLLHLNANCRWRSVRSMRRTVQRRLHRYSLVFVPPVRVRQYGNELERLRLCTRSTHQVCAVRRVASHATVRNDDLVRLNLRHGCTAIDHCVDVHELLERPYIAVPAIF